MKLFQNKDTSKWKGRILVGGITVALIAGTLVFYVNARTKQPVAEPLQTVSLEQQDLQKTLSITGTIASMEKQTPFSETTGVKVKAVHVKVGDQVKAGDLLFELDDTTLQDKLSLEMKSLSAEQQKASLDVNTAQKNLSEAQTTQQIEVQRADNSVVKSQQEQTKLEKEKAEELKQWENSIKNRNNKQDELNKANDAKNAAYKAWQDKQNALAKLKAQQSTQPSTPDPAPTVSGNESHGVDAQAGGSEASGTAGGTSGNGVTSAELTAAEAAVTYAETDYNNKLAAAQKLEQELADAKNNASTQESEFNSKNKEWENAKDNHAKVVESKDDTIRNQNKSVQSSNDSLSSSRLNSATTGMQSKSNIDILQEQIADCVVRATMDGIVTSISVTEGASYKGGDMAVIQNVEGFKVSAGVDQYDISDVALGMRVLVSTETTGAERMEGTITFISPVPQSMTSTDSTAATSTGGTAATGTNTAASSYPIEITLKNPSDRLRIGMTSKVEIIKQELKNALTVPYNCVLQNEKGEDYITVVEINAETGEQTQRNLIVEKTMETDYYIGVASALLTAGMQVLVPQDLTEDQTMEMQNQ